MKYRPNHGLFYPLPLGHAIESHLERSYPLTCRFDASWYCIPIVVKRLPYLFGTDVARISHPTVREQEMKSMSANHISARWLGPMQVLVCSAFKGSHAIVIEYISKSRWEPIFPIRNRSPLMPPNSHVLPRITHARLRQPHVNRRAYSSASARSSCGLKGIRRCGARPSWYLPEVADQNMYSQSSAVPLRPSCIRPLSKRFASEMSVHRTKYAAVVVGGGPAGITVGSYGTRLYKVYF